MSVAQKAIISEFISASRGACAWRASCQWSSVKPEGGQANPFEVATLSRAT